MTKRNEASDRESSREQKQGDQKLPEIEKSKTKRKRLHNIYNSNPREGSAITEKPKTTPLIFQQTKSGNCTIAKREPQVPFMQQ